MAARRRLGLPVLDLRPSAIRRGFGMATWKQAVAVVSIAALVLAQTPNAEAVTYVPVFYYYHADHLGSSNVLTDRAGERVQHYEYTAFGVEAFKDNCSAFPVSNRYTGQILDEETGLYYYNARYYDPELGRFVQPDAFADPASPQDFNPYSYVINNPLNLTDPSGHGVGDAVDARQAKAEQNDGGMTPEQLAQLDKANRDLKQVLREEEEIHWKMVGGWQFVYLNNSRVNHVNTVVQEAQDAVVKAVTAQSQSSGGGLGSAAKLLLGFVPGVSTVLSFMDAFKDFAQGKPLSGLLNLGLGLASLTAAGGALRAVKTLATGAKVAHLANKSARLKEGAELIRQAADRAMARLAQNPGELPLTEGERFLGRHFRLLQPMVFGRGFERAVAKELTDMGAPLAYRGMWWGPDFIGTGPLAGTTFELTTPGAVGRHLLRPNPAQAVVTYPRPPTDVFFGK